MNRWYIRCCRRSPPACQCRDRRNKCRPWCKARRRCRQCCSSCSQERNRQTTECRALGDIDQRRMFHTRFWFPEQGCSGAQSTPKFRCKGRHLREKNNRCPSRTRRGLDLLGRYLASRNLLGCSRFRLRYRVWS